MNKVTRGDYLLAGIILVLSLGSFYVFGFGGGSVGRGIVAIRVDGRLTATFDLSVDRTVSPIPGGPNMSIEVKDGSVRVLDSDCRLKVCRNSGSISQPGRTIICAPNRVVLTIEGGKGPEYDAESY